MTHAVVKAAYEAAKLRIDQLRDVARQCVTGTTCIICDSHEYVAKSACFPASPRLCNTCHSREIQHVWLVNDYELKTRLDMPVEYSHVPVPGGTVLRALGQAEERLESQRRAAQRALMPPTEFDLPPWKPVERKEIQRAMMPPEQFSVEMLGERRASRRAVLNDVQQQPLDVKHNHAPLALAAAAAAPKPVPGRKFDVKIAAPTRYTSSPGEIARVRHASTQEHTRSVTAAARGLPSNAPSRLFCKQHDYHGLDACPSCKQRVALRNIDEFVKVVITAKT